MNYEIQGRGGLYPEGCSFHAQTAEGALERYQAVRAACGSAQAFAAGKRVRRTELMSMARAERRDQT